MSPNEKLSILCSVCSMPCDIREKPLIGCASHAAIIRDLKGALWTLAAYRPAVERCCPSIDAVDQVMKALRELSDEPGQAT